MEGADSTRNYDITRREHFSLEDSLDDNKTDAETDIDIDLESFT